MALRMRGGAKGESFRGPGYWNNYGSNSSNNRWLAFLRRMVGAPSYKKCTKAQGRSFAGYE